MEILTERLIIHIRVLWDVMLCSVTYKY